MIRRLTIAEVGDAIKSGRESFRISELPEDIVDHLVRRERRRYILERRSTLRWYRVIERDKQYRLERMNLGLGWPPTTT